MEKTGWAELLWSGAANGLLHLLHLVLPALLHQSIFLTLLKICRGQQGTLLEVSSLGGGSGMEAEKPVLGRCSVKHIVHQDLFSLRWVGCCERNNL